MMTDTPFNIRTDQNIHLLYLLSYDAVLFKVLWSELIVTGQAAYFDLWIPGFNQLSTKA